MATKWREKNKTGIEENNGPLSFEILSNQLLKWIELRNKPEHEEDLKS